MLQVSFPLKAAIGFLNRMTQGFRRIAAPDFSRGFQSTESNSMFPASRQRRLIVPPVSNVAPRHARLLLQPWAEAHGYRHPVATRPRERFLVYHVAHRPKSTVTEG